MVIQEYVKGYSQLINMIPNYFSIVDIKNKLLFANQTSINSFGFKELHEIIGKKFDNLNSPLTESANFITNLNRLVFQKKEALQFISLFHYKTGRILTLGTKSPIFNNEEVIGLSTCCIDITKSHLIDISRFLYENNHGMNNINKINFMYVLKDREDKYSLSERQIECLFYLIRGKTDKEIAKLLVLSPRIVESYINEIKFKMYCKGRSEIVEKSFTDGLLTMMPKKLLSKINLI